jgi:hypothetical protein
MASNHPDDIRLSPQILAISASDTEAVFQKIETSREGLTPREAGKRLKNYGRNVVAQDKRHNR